MHPNYYSRKQLEAFGEPLGDLTRLSVTQSIQCHGGGKGDSPDAPDYKAAAEATAAGNAEAARIQSKANRVSQYTPYGNLVYTQGTNDPTFDQSAYDAAMAQYNKELDQYNRTQQRYNNIPMISGYSTFNRMGTAARPTAPNRADFMTVGDPDRWSARVELAPAQQALLDKQNEISLGLGDSMSKALGYVNDQLSTPFDTSGLPEIMTPDVAGQEAIVNALMERQRPQFDERRSQTEADLLMRGFNPGTSGWNSRFDDLGRSENDARLAAIMAGGQEQSRLFGLQQTARQQALQEQAFLRNEPLNTLNAVRTGAQVTNPTFVNTPQQAYTPGPDYLGAANAGYQGQLNAYNAEQGAKGNLFGGLAGMAGGALGAPAAPWWMG